MSIVDHTDEATLARKQTPSRTLPSCNDSIFTSLEDKTLVRALEVKVLQITSAEEPITQEGCFSPLSSFDFTAHPCRSYCSSQTNGRLLMSVVQEGVGVCPQTHTAASKMCGWIPNCSPDENTEKSSCVLIGCIVCFKCTQLVFCFFVFFKSKSLR